MTYHPLDLCLVVPTALVGTMLKTLASCTALVLLLAASPARGQSMDTLFDAPCERYGVPKQLALAIATKESAMRPWALNIEGRTVQASSKEQALAVGRAALVAGLSFDVGTMQVNSWWLRRYKLPLEDVLDQPGNIQVGVWILAHAIRQHGLTWRAVAAYHTPNVDTERGRAYAEDVIRILRGEPRARAVTVSSHVPAASSHAPVTTSAAAPMLVKRYRVVAEDTERVVRPEGKKN